MIKSFKLFTTPMCPNCPAVKEYVDSIELEGDKIDATTDEGRDEAVKFSVMSVPTLIFFDENNNEVSRAGSVEEAKRAIENKMLV